jgi:hypothetical protein
MAARAAAVASRAIQSLLNALAGGGGWHVWN